MRLLTFLFEDLAWIGCGLEHVAEVRQPHEPERLGKRIPKR